MSSTLRVKNLFVHFGGVKAVDDVTLEVLPGEVFGLIGPNGAGKSTVINALTGFAPAEARVIEIENDGVASDLRGLRSHRRIRLGIARTFQTPRLIPELSVALNVTLGTVGRDVKKRWFESFGGPALARGQRERTAVAIEILESFGLDHLADNDPRDLSLGEQRLIEIARSMVSGAQVLLLDEPFAGLSSEEQKRLSGEIKRLRTSGLALLLIEHHLDHVRALADTVLVMDQGKELARGTATDVLDSAIVRERYLGEVIA